VSITTFIVYHWRKGHSYMERSTRPLRSNELLGLGSIAIQLRPGGLFTTVVMLNLTGRTNLEPIGFYLEIILEKNLWRHYICFIKSDELLRGVYATDYLNKKQ